MKISSLLTCTILLCILIGCTSEKDDRYFNGKIQYIDNSHTISESIKSHAVPLYGNSTGIISVYDSLLICWSPAYSDHFFKIFNIDTGKELGSFCEKGLGGSEATTINCLFQLFKIKNDIQTLLYAPNEGKLFFWNISQSIQKNTTVYDSIIPYKNNRIFCQFYQSEDRLFAYKPADEINHIESTTPYYEKRSIHTNELIQKYSIYKTNSIQNADAETPIDFFFYTWDAMKSDGSKIVQAMRFLPQINILDTHTGELIGYRFKKRPNFSLLETDMKDMTVYYNHVHADDKYIYATYWGEKQWNDRLGTELPSFNTIHVFDWNGKLMYNLTTDQSFFRVWSDPVRKRLYTIDMNTDEVFYIDLTFLD